MDRMYMFIKLTSILDNVIRKKLSRVFFGWAKGGSLSDRKTNYIVYCYFSLFNLSTNLCFSLAVHHVC